MNIQVIAASPDGETVVIVKGKQQGFLRKGQSLDTVKWKDGGSILASAILKAEFMPVDPPQPYKGGA